MRIILSLALLAACAYGQKPWNQEPDGFKGIPFGATAADASKTGLVLSCMGIPTAGSKICTTTVDLGSVRLSAYLQFEDGKFVAVVADFPSDSYATVRAIFIERYGDPHDSATKVVQNRMGAKFENEALAWEGKVASIHLSRYGSKLTEGLIYISTQEFAHQQNSKSNQSVKEAAGKL